jgi:CHAD domain-containing protein
MFKQTNAVPAAPRSASAPQTAAARARQSSHWRADAPALLASRFAAILQARAHRYVTLLRETRRTPTRPRVHALRIATRRLLTALALTKSVSPAAQRRHIELILQETFTACGRVRNLQLAQRAVAAAASRTPGLDDLAGHVRHRLRKRRRRLAHHLQHAHPRRIERALFAMAAGISRDAVESRRSPAIQQALSRNLERSLHRGAAGRIGRESPASLHRTRRALRVYRNRLALANQLGGRVPARYIAQLTRRQSALGAVNDYNTLLRIVDNYGRRRPAGPAVQRYRLHIQERRDRAMGRLRQAKVNA